MKILPTDLFPAFKKDKLERNEPWIIELSEKVPREIVDKCTVAIGEILQNHFEGTPINKSSLVEAAATLGSKGGSKGGYARAVSMTPKQRTASARKAALARWRS